jgi:hypothetical protein
MEAKDIHKEMLPIWARLKRFVALFLTTLQGYFSWLRQAETIDY